jgi:hypothetical protein
MIDWINTAPPAELAAELMAAFDPQVPRRVSRLAISDFNDWMFRGYLQRSGMILLARQQQLLVRHPPGLGDSRQREGRGQAADQGSNRPLIIRPAQEIGPEALKDRQTAW